MNLKNKIKFALFTVIFISIFLVTIYFASAGCCISDDCTDTALTTCDSGATYNASSCDSLQQCDAGCCCSPDGIYAIYGIRDACTKKNTTYAFNILSLSTNCLTFCDPSKTYTVSGYIKNSTGFLSGAIVENSINTVKVTTTSTGYYSFSNMPSSFTITASKPGCNAGTLTFSNIDSNKINQNITLICSACYWTYTGWSINCEDGINTRGVTGNSSPTCTLAQLGVPIITEACELPSTCNGLVLETSEECEVDADNEFVGDRQCASGSTADCINCKCDSHISPEDACLTDPGNFTIIADYTKHVLKFDLSWQPSKPECNQYIDNFKLDKCSGLDCSNWVNLWSGESSIIYTDAIIEPNKFYCYKLTTNYQLEMSAKTTKNCFYAGDEYCFSGSPDPNCMTKIRNSIISCDDKNNVSTTSCEVEEYCTFVDNLPVCKNQSKCEKCNAFFGLFGYQGLNIFLKDDDEDTTECPTLNVPYRIEGCYVDYTKTAVDMSKECKNVASCYDYFSEENCISDFCEKIDDCEWIPYNKQFNKGVCRPINTENQNCNLCNKDANNRFYEDCTKDTCVLYGGNLTKTSCYFDGDDCLNKSQMSCFNYISQEDCIGLLGKQQNVSLDVFWSLVGGVKIGYTNKLLKSSNDSLDLGRCKWIGSTEDGICIKDSDGNNTEDCVFSNNAKQAKCNKDYFPPQTTIDNKQAYNTYMNLTNSLVVEDNSWYFRETDPQYRINLYYCINTTTQTCYPNKLINRLEPSGVLAENRYWIDVPSDLTEKTYNLFYYVEDPSRNLEVVKNFTFDFDKTAPVLSLTKYYVVRKIGNEYRSDITFNITLNEEKNLLVTCSFSLKRDDAQNYYWLKYYDINEKEITAINGKLTTTYPDLGDGDYKYTLDCYDLAENHYTLIDKGLFIEGDMRINSPTPRNIVFRNADVPKEISIKTENLASCKYSSSTMDFSQMTSTFTRTPYTTEATIQYYHNASMPALISGVNLYMYYTACSIQSNPPDPEIVERDSADWIYFSIDELAPKTTMNAISRNLSTYSCNEWDECSYTETDKYDSSKTTNKIELNLICNDSDSSLYSSTFNKYLSFGCNQTYYCLQESEEICDVNNDHHCIHIATRDGRKCDNLENYDILSNILIIDYLDETTGSYYKTYGNYPELCYYSTDKGGNVESEKHCMILNIKNTRFDEPIISIQMPRTPTGGITIKDTNNELN